MATLELNGKSLATQTSTAEPVLASTVTGGAGLSGSTSLGTVTVGNLSNTAIVYPAGHVINTTYAESGGTSQTQSGSTAVAGFNYIPVTCTIGNTLLASCTYVITWERTASLKNERWGYTYLYQSTSSVAQGATSSLGTLLFTGQSGRIMIAVSDQNAHTMATYTMIGAFVATATTHYVGMTFKTSGSVNITAELKLSMQPAITVVQEIQGDIT